jgi:G:T/U mismatch-specific DNA glycosylase
MAGQEKRLTGPREGKKVTNAQHVIHPFPPLFDAESRILILGSFPSVKSREQQFFYGHPRNRFWSVIAAVYGEAVPETVPQKRELILRNHLALWDTIGSCEILGSSDASIRKVKANDLRIILDNSRIERIFCNGKTSYAWYCRLIEPALSRPAECLPSTSPANAQWSLDQLTEAWKNGLLG